MMNIDEFEWRGGIAAWVDKDGKPVSAAKEHELNVVKGEIKQQQIMERLDAARAVFYSMANNVERRAALEWLRETHGL